MDHFQIVTVDVATPELASVSVVANGILSFDDWDSALNSSEVAITGTVTHAINTDKVASDGWQPNARVNISCNNLTITSEGKIDVVGKGFQGGEAGSQAIGNGGTLQLHSSPTNGVSPGYGNRVYVSGDFTVFTNGLVRVYSHPTNGGSVFFDVNTLRVFANGSLSANAGGFFGRLKTGGTGPGAGLTSGADRGGGGGYGGKGATSTYDTSRPAKGGSAYGSAVLPLLCGSSGGRDGGAGGGLIWMRVRGSTFVDGVVPANGGIPGSTLDGEKAEPGTVVFLTAPPHATLMIVR